MRADIEFNWIDGATLAIRRGMTGATGNVYCGLHEFVEMAFLLHFLRPGDLFLDIGANIGSYTILASKVCGARSIAFEPDPGAANALRRNVALNALENLVTIKQVALGKRTGKVAFTVGLDTMNRVAKLGDNGDSNVQTVPIEHLDDIADAAAASFVKLDVEGFEEEVLAGATNALSSRSLLAVQSESSTPPVKTILASFGFCEMFYEPFSRELSSTSFGYRTSNGIFIRDLLEVKRRLREAASRDVLGTDI